MLAKTVFQPLPAEASNPDQMELDKTIQVMAKGQLNKELTPEQNSDIAAYLKTLTGEIPAEAKQAPAMP